MVANLRLTENFSWAEVVGSVKAKEHGIDNEPTDEKIIQNIHSTADLMQRLRDILGERIDVSSWYRCPKLNILVGGSATSAHLQGLAVDFVSPLFGTPEEIVRALIPYVKELEIDQLICEDNRWVHAGFGGKQRDQVLRMIQRPGQKPLYVEFV